MTKQNISSIKIKTIGVGMSESSGTSFECDVGGLPEYMLETVLIMQFGREGAKEIVDKVAESLS